MINALPIALYCAIFFVFAHHSIRLEESAVIDSDIRKYAQKGQHMLNSHMLAHNGSA